MKKKVLHLCYVFLAKCAHRYLKRHKPTVIWINWSVWKTSCRMIIFQTLQKFFPNKKISTSPKNFNWEFWLSLSVFEITKRSPSIFNMIKVCKLVENMAIDEIRKIGFSEPMYKIYCCIRDFRGYDIETLDIHFKE